MDFDSRGSRFYCLRWLCFPKSFGFLFAIAFPIIAFAAWFWLRCRGLGTTLRLCGFDEDQHFLFVMVKFQSLESRIHRIQCGK